MRGPPPVISNGFPQFPNVSPQKRPSKNLSILSFSGSATPIALNVFKGLTGLKSIFPNVRAGPNGLTGLFPLGTPATTHRLPAKPG